MTTQRFVVVFDLDGTLSRRDSYLSYLAGFLLRHPWRLFRTLPLLWAVLQFALRRLDNTELKQRFLSAVLGGASRADVDAWTRVFVERLVAGGLRGEAVEALEHHRMHGDRLVLLTASFDVYVEELGRRLNFHDVMCTKVEWMNGRLSGRLAGPNLRGEEKVQCLLRLKTEYPGASIIAYADHHSDLAFLRLADRATLVNGTPATRDLAMQQGICCAIWKR